METHAYIGKGVWMGVYSRCFCVCMRMGDEVREWIARAKRKLQGFSRNIDLPGCVCLVAETKLMLQRPFDFLLEPSYEKEEQGPNIC